MTTDRLGRRSRRLSCAVWLAAIALVAAALPAASASVVADPEPLRRARTLRAQDITARGDLVAISWRERDTADRLLMSLSRDGGASYRRGNGRLRTFNLAGIPGRGAALAICGRGDGRSIWAVTILRARSDRAGDADVLLTRRNGSRPKGDAGQLFITRPVARRQVRDADVACVGNHHLAIAWLERKDGRLRARLSIRRLTPDGVSRPVRTYDLGSAVLGGGIAVDATPDIIHVAWTVGSRKHLRFARLEVESRADSRFDRRRTRRLAWRDVERPKLAARGRSVVLAYTDGGEVKVRTSQDRGASFGPAERLANGSVQAPSRARSVSLSGQRIVVEAIDRSSGQRVPTRLESPDLGVSWSGLAFGHVGARLGALQKIDYRTSRLMELLHHDGSGGDTLRARHEEP